MSTRNNALFETKYWVYDHDDEGSVSAAPSNGEHRISIDEEVIKLGVIMVSSPRSKAHSIQTQQPLQWE